MRNVLVDASEMRAIVAQVDLEFARRRFTWASFIPRTDDFVDLRKKSVGCNILITLTPPYIAVAQPFPHPEHISAEGRLQVRGYGQLALRS